MDNDIPHVPVPDVDSDVDSRVDSGVNSDVDVDDDFYFVDDEFDFDEFDFVEDEWVIFDITDIITHHCNVDNAKIAFLSAIASYNLSKMKSLFARPIEDTKTEYFEAKRALKVAEEKQALCFCVDIKVE
jgi:hypothetical protein